MDTAEKRIDWLTKELNKAYTNARRGKTSKPQVAEFDKNSKLEIAKLAREIHSRSYQPQPSTAFIVNRPVKREIFAAQFRDRVVHHFLFNQVNKWWDARFIEDNYSCRVGKGTLYGIRRLDHHIRSCSRNYTKPAYILKLDLQGYFMSLNRKKLYQRAMWGLDRQFPNKLDLRKTSQPSERNRVSRTSFSSIDVATATSPSDKTNSESLQSRPEESASLRKSSRGYNYQSCKFLWKTIIFNDPLKNVSLNCPRSAWKGLPPSKSLFHQPKGQGIAIGNLTSQLLSNMYLDQLDRFVTLELGFKHYGRYVDDFYIVSSSKEELVKATIGIERYLERNLLLALHPHKRHLQECHKGVAFLGAVVYPFRIHPGKRLKHNLLAALLSPDCSPETETSYRGLVKHYKNKKLLSSLSHANI